MLRRGNRLTSSQSFAQAVRRGRRAGSKTLVLHLALGEEDGHQGLSSLSGPSASSPGDGSTRSRGRLGDGPQVGFVVSKAVGPAVTRNLVKRRLRHLVRERLPMLSELPTSAVVVVRALPGAATASYSALAADFDKAWSRVAAFSAPGARGAAGAPGATGASEVAR